MLEYNLWASLSIIFGMPILILGSLITYFALGCQIKQIKKEFNILSEHICLQNIYRCSKSINEVIIYNYALSPAEIEEIRKLRI